MNGKDTLKNQVSLLVLRSQLGLAELDVKALSSMSEALASATEKLSSGNLNLTSAEAHFAGVALSQFTNKEDYSHEPDFEQPLILAEEHYARTKRDYDEFLLTVDVDEVKVPRELEKVIMKCLRETYKEFDYSPGGEILSSLTLDKTKNFIENQSNKSL